jgi:hypothetical protein
MSIPVCVIPHDREFYETRAALVGGFYMPDQHVICVTPEGYREWYMEPDTAEWMDWQLVLCRIREGNGYWYNRMQHERYRRLR